MLAFLSLLLLLVNNSHVKTSSVLLTSDHNTSPGLAEDFLQDYIQVNIGSLELCANHNITQIIEICEDYEKEYK